MEKGSLGPQKWSKIAPASVPHPEALHVIMWASFGNAIAHVVDSTYWVMPNIAKIHGDLRFKPGMYLVGSQQEIRNQNKGTNSGKYKNRIPKALTSVACANRRKQSIGDDYSHEHHPSTINKKHTIKANGKAETKNSKRGTVLWIWGVAGREGQTNYHFQFFNKAQSLGMLRMARQEHVGIQSKSLRSHGCWRPMACWENVALPWLEWQYCFLSFPSFRGWGPMLF